MNIKLGYCDSCNDEKPCIEIESEYVCQECINKAFIRNKITITEDIVVPEILINHCENMLGK